nr:hypothetical protein [Tanacetum cinerariifolium]
HVLTTILIDSHKVPDTKDSIRFKLNTQKITYTVDMFCDTLKLPMETPDNLFITPVTIETIESFMQTVGYQGVVDKKYPSIPRRHDEDYHSIKDDTPLVSVYSVGNVLFQGMRIPDAFIIAEIHAIDEYKEYEMVFDRVDVPINQPQPVISTQRTHRTTPSAYRTHTLTATSDDQEMDEVAEAAILSLTLHKTVLAAKAQENIAKVQEKLDEEEIKRMVEGEEDEESYASKFADSMLNDDVDDSGTRIELESHKEHPKNVNDNDEDIEKEKKDDDVEKRNEVVKEKDYDEVAMGSMETKNKKMQTPIPTPTRSPRKDLSSD